MGEIHWEMFGASVRGAAHSRDGRPTSGLHRPGLGMAAPGVLRRRMVTQRKIVSNDRGSRFAVQAASKEILTIIGPPRRPRKPLRHQRMAGGPAAEIVEALDRSGRYRSPGTDGESRVEVGVAADCLWLHNPCCWADRELRVYCQLGDGDILCASCRRMKGNASVLLTKTSAFSPTKLRLCARRRPGGISGLHFRCSREDAGHDSAGNRRLFEFVPGRQRVPEGRHRYTGAIRCEGWESVIKRPAPSGCRRCLLRGSGDDITVGPDAQKMTSSRRPRWNRQPRPSTP